PQKFPAATTRGWPAEGAPEGPAAPPQPASRSPTAASSSGKTRRGDLGIHVLQTGRSGCLGFRSPNDNTRIGISLDPTVERGPQAPEVRHQGGAIAWAAPGHDRRDGRNVVVRRLYGWRLDHRAAHSPTEEP